MTELASVLRVCFFSHSSRMDGAERSLLELVTQLISDYGVTCAVVLPSDGPLREKLESAGAATAIVEYYWWCEPGVSGQDKVEAPLEASFEALMVNLDAIRAMNPHVVVTNTLVIPWGAIAAFLIGLPHVWYVREFGELDHRLKFNLPFDSVLKFIHQSSNVILTNSNAVKEALFPHEPSDRVRTVYNSVSIPTGAVAENAGDRAFTDPGAAKLLMTGGTRPGKGQEEAILAVKELVARNRSVELVIMGRESSYSAELARLVSEHGLERHVTFLPFRDNPFPVVAEADIVLVCSKREAFGRVTVEAMLLEKPVVGANTGGTTELIRDGFNGYLYQAGDAGQLAARIEQLIDHPEVARQLGRNGSEFARSTLTPERYGGAIDLLLRDLKEQSNPLPAQYIAFMADRAAKFHGRGIAVRYQQTIDAQIESLQRAESQIRDQAEALHRAESQIGDQVEALRRAESQIGEQSEALRRAESQMEDMGRSLSWRVAAAVRSVVRRIRGLV